MPYNKYRNKKTIVNGIEFDSKAEASRYSELLLMQKAGLIADIELQPKFILQPKFTKGGKIYRETTYIADFAYLDLNTKQKVVEDVKGMKTEVYKLKKKLFLFTHPELTLKEII